MDTENFVKSFLNLQCQIENLLTNLDKNPNLDRIIKVEPKTKKQKENSVGGYGIIIRQDINTKHDLRFSVAKYDCSVESDKKEFLHIATIDLVVGQLSLQQFRTYISANDYALVETLYNERFAKQK